MKSLVCCLKKIEAGSLQTKSDIIRLILITRSSLTECTRTTLSGDLDAFTAEEQAEMRAFCAAKAAEFAEMYKVANAIAAYPESE